MAAFDNDGDVVALCNVAVVSKFYQRVSSAVAGGDQIALHIVESGLELVRGMDHEGDGGV